MAVVQSGNSSGEYLIDDLIQVETIGRKIQLRDATTGAVMENVGAGDVTLSTAARAANVSSYGASAAGVERAQKLISSGKWATHQAHENYNITPNNN